MRIRKPGKIRSGLWALGREESRVYLIEGNDASMIVSGGMSYIVQEMLQQFREFGIDEEKIEKLLILHSHFDHVGIIPFFKRRHPEMEVLASERGWEILQMPKAVSTINEFSRNVAERMGREEIYSAHDLDWREDVTGRSVHEGDRINVGGIEVSIFETPGHSSCSITAYVSEWKALFPTDGGGIPFKEMIVPSGNSNYTQFQGSLEKLKGLEVDYYCADHYGHVVGEEARDFIRQSIEMARRHRNQIEEALRSEGDIDKASKKLVSSFYQDNPDYFLSPDIFAGVYRQIVRHIASAMDR
jgi:glyoxylase-like metal-dependent hydrolase (beta-lactamase superfamily II)